MKLTEADIEGLMIDITEQLRRRPTTMLLLHAYLMQRENDKRLELNRLLYDLVEYEE